MVIYADILFITNLYIDFFLLICVKKFLKLNTSHIRIFCGALAGAVYSLSAVLPSITKIQSTLLGILGALSITLAAFAPNKKAVLIKATISFYVFSFIFAGFFMLIYNIIPTNNLTVKNGLVYFNISPITLFVFTLLAYLVTVIFRRLFSSGDNTAAYQTFTITNKGKTSKVFAKADTGNSLCEPFSGLPAMVIEFDAVRELLPDSIVEYIQTGESSERLRLIPFTSIGGSGILPAFQPDSICFGKNHQTVKCYLAIHPKKLSAGQFNAIYHPNILTENISAELKRK